MEPLNIMHEYVLPKQFRFFGILALIFAIIFFTQHINLFGFLVSSASVFLGALMLTARYGLSLDTSQKQYKEFVSLLWFQSGNWKDYTGIEKIFINKIVESERMVSRSGAKFDFKSQSCQAYIKFDDGQKIELDSDKSKERLLARLKEYNEQLQTIIQDNAL